MKSDAQTTSSSRPSVGAMAALVAETPVVEAPVNETLGAEAQLSPLLHLLPWRQVERAMADCGQSKWRLAKMRHFKGVGLRSVPGPNLGGVSQNHCFPSSPGQ